MSLYLSIINYRTFIVLLISVLTTWMAYYFEIDFYVDLTLLSIAIIFPLVFTIRGSFRRREKALEHLSKFRGSMKTVQYFVINDTELSEEQKSEASSILVEISEKVIDHLGNNDHTTEELDAIIDQVQAFVRTNSANMANRSKDRILRLMKDLHESLENLHAINTHRTPVSLKAYCLLFIYLFPFIYSPTIINNLGELAHPAIAYFVVILTEFILITLYNIQDQLEYPFDDYGLDDINLEAFKIDR